MMVNLSPEDMQADVQTIVLILGGIAAVITIWRFMQKRKDFDG